jgi:hypothetical protein
VLPGGNAHAPEWPGQHAALGRALDALGRARILVLVGEPASDPDRMDQNRQPLLDLSMPHGAKTRVVASRLAHAAYTRTRVLET